MGILSKIKVVDLTRVRSGPTCVKMLSDWDAQVIKVEQPTGDPEADVFSSRNSSDFQNLHRNKRSIALDFKNEKGREILLKLIEQADVVVENFRPDVKRRLKIDYDTVRARNPRIIYASISGFGQDGPYADRPGVDQIAQGMGGLMSVTGEPGSRPLRVGIPIADLTAGLFCAYGILLALYDREQTGEGQTVDTSLLAAQILMLDFQAVRWLIDREVPWKVGNEHPIAMPTNAYKTSDGYVNIAANNNDMFKKLSQAIGVDLSSDPRFSTTKGRNSNREPLNFAIEAATLTKPSAHWVEILNKLGVPCGPIYTIDKMFDDPQVKHLGITGSVQHKRLGALEILGSAIKLSRNKAQMDRAAPDAGENNDEILAELGYDEKARAAIKAAGAVG
jgi:crotonobetainyl-CoA:carnitine CoA-transferase CaiB-like acyl-CoA transferase